MLDKNPPAAFGKLITGQATARQFFVKSSGATALRRVVCAAIRSSKGDIVLGARHYDTFMHNALDKLPEDIRQNFIEVGDQGFIDNQGNYLNRKEALAVAVAAQQIIRDHHHIARGELYSEMLY